MSIRYDGKVAIVTGAGQGLGHSHAIELAKRGAKVVINDLGGGVDGSGGSSEAAKAVVAEIEAMGGEAIANGANVAKYGEVEAMVKQAMDKCNAVFEDQTGESLLDLIYPKASTAEGADSSLNMTKYTQPSLFAVEWSLAELWRARGVTPALCLGHSIGEIAAACVAGVMDVESGMRLTIERGALMQALPAGEGVMAAVRCNQAEAEAAISALDLEALAAVASANGPDSCVVAGADADRKSVV